MQSNLFSLFTNLIGVFMAVEKKGSIVFLFGIILAILLGLIAGLAPSAIIGLEGFIALAMVALGFIAGFVNIKNEHRNEFLIAVIAVALVGIITIQQSSALIPIIAPLINSIFQNIVSFSAPAALVVGLKQIWSLGTSA